MQEVHNVYKFFHNLGKSIISGISQTILIKQIQVFFPPEHRVSGTRQHQHEHSFLELASLITQNYNKTTYQPLPNSWTRETSSSNF